MNRQKLNEDHHLLDSFESQLEGFAERVLNAKINDDDDVFAEVQAVIERVFIRSAMKLTKENVSKAAKLLGMSRNTLIRKLKGPAVH